VPTVVLIGTLDTKGREYAFVRDRLREAGVDVLVADVGVLREPPFEPDVSAAEVARLAGRELHSLRFAREGSDTRARALAVMGQGAAALLRRLHAERRCDGALGVAGSGGSTVIAEAMRALPVGVPKLLVTTMVASSAGDYIGTRDLCLLNPVTDIAGVNRVSRLILSNAAAAIAGMAVAPAAPTVIDRPLVALTMMGVTTPCVLRVQEGLERAGLETIVFHAVGTGGRALEEMIADGLIDGVCDVTTHELTDHELGGIFDAGPDRLMSAGRRRIPLVAIPGALEFVNFGPRATVPAHLDVPERKIVVHNPSVCAVRITCEEAEHVGHVFADRVNEAAGPVVVVLPLRGCSSYELDDGPFFDPLAATALVAAIRSRLQKDVDVVEVDANLNDPAAADAICAVFLELWRTSRHDT
jgi:uncharacterized protein (UPF0261 family)